MTSSVPKDPALKTSLEDFDTTLAAAGLSPAGKRQMARHFHILRSQFFLQRKIEVLHRQPHPMRIAYQNAEHRISTEIANGHQRIKKANSRLRQRLFSHYFRRVLPWVSLAALLGAMIWAGFVYGPVLMENLSETVAPSQPPVSTPVNGTSVTPNAQGGTP